MACFIRLVPFRDVGNLPFEALTETLNEVFGLPIEVAKQIPLLEEAYDSARSQWRAESLLESICHTCKEKRVICLGLTTKDCYADSLNFVFGLARNRPPCALVATARLDPSFYGEGENPALFLRRLATEAVHEIGHTLGLDHCPDPHCVMHFSNTLADTDRKGYRFCPRCRARVEEALAPCRA